MHQFKTALYQLNCSLVQFSWYSTNLMLQILMCYFKTTLTCSKKHENTKAKAKAESESKSRKRRKRLIFYILKIETC